MSTDIVCFIINSIIPYKFDVNQIVALRTGLTYRNRWKSQWVEPALSNNISELKSKEVLLVLRDWKKDRLIPLRWGTIYLATKIGDVFYFEYQLGDLVKYDSDEDARSKQIDAINRKFVQLHSGIARAIDGPIKPSVFMSQIHMQLEHSLDTDLDAWGNLVSALGDVEAFNGIEFIKIIDIKHLDERAIIKGRAFELYANSTYELSVFQTIPKTEESPPPHDIELKVLDSQVAVLRGKQRAVGRYDVLRFIFRIKDIAGETGIMELVHSDEARALPSIAIPINIIPRAKFIRYAAVVLTLIFSLSPDLFGALTLNTELVRAIALIMFVITVNYRQIIANYWPNKE